MEKWLKWAIEIQRQVTKRLKQIQEQQYIYAYGVCKIFVMCEIISGEFKKNIETTEMKYFALDELPENFANEKCTKEQVKMCFEARDDENWKVQFD